MKISRESIFLSSIRSFFSTLLGTFGIFLAFIPIMIVISIFSTSDYRQAFKNKLEILPDLNGNAKLLSLNSPTVLQIDVHGVIGKSPITAEDFMYQLLESRKGLLKNDRVKAILLNINSPGGSALDSDDIYKNLLKYKEKYNVPIYAYANGLLASGSFMISLAADKIYATKFSIVGSVGSIVGPFFNVSKTLKNWGVETQTITDGKDKDMMNPLRPWEKGEDQSLKDINEFIYGTFVDMVAKQRNIDKDTIINEYGAKVFTSKKAKEIGYIDEDDACYSDTLKALLAEAKIDTAKPYQVVTLTPKKYWLSPLVTQTKLLFESFFKENISFKHPIKLEAKP